MIKLLVNNGGAQLIEFKSTGGSPLHAAISCETESSEETLEVDRGQRAFETVSLLLSLYRGLGKDVKNLVNSKDPNGVAPLMLACFVGDISVVQLLIESGSDPLLASTASNATILHVCGERGFLEIAQMVLAKCPGLVYEVDHEKGNSPLHVATEWDYIELVKLYAEVGGRQLAVELKNKKGFNSIDIAYQNNTQASYSYLCKKFKVQRKCLFCEIF